MGVWLGLRAVLNVVEREQCHLPGQKSILAAGELELWIRDLYEGGTYHVWERIEQTDKLYSQHKQEIQLHD
jgi:hypothetical protein